MLQYLFSGSRNATLLEGNVFQLIMHMVSPDFDTFQLQSLVIINLEKILNMLRNGRTDEGKSIP